MIYVVVQGPIGLFDGPDQTGPHTAGLLGKGDHFDDSNDPTHPGWVKGEVVGPPPRRKGWVQLSALQPFTPSADIVPEEFYAYIQLQAERLSSDQRYLYALANAMSGLKNIASSMAGSDAFGPFQYSVAHWTSLVQLFGSAQSVTANDRSDPFKQATVAAVDSRRIAASLQSALGRTAQLNELYVMHILGDVGGLEVVANAAKAPTKAIMDALSSKLSPGDANTLIASYPGVKRIIANGSITVAAALAAAGDALQPGLDATLAFEPLSSPSSTGPTTTSSIPDPGALVGSLSLAKQAYEFFIQKGWSKAQSCGIIANVKGESNFKIDALGDTETADPAYGLCQWRGERKTNFLKAIGKPLKGSDFPEQLQFIDHELRTAGEQGEAGIALKQTKTPSEAADVVTRKYERPKNPDADSKIRAGYAQAYFNQFATSEIA